MKVKVKDGKKVFVTEDKSLRITKEGLIVLFMSRCCGVVLHNSPTSNYTLGSYHTDWSPSEFSPFNGSVKLSN